jgi:hypothetical protein
MGGMAFSISTGEIVLFLSIVIGIFLAGYVPYVHFSVKLARQAGTEEGPEKRIKVWASIFAAINTFVFLVSVSTMAEGGIVILIGDILLWGIPFYFFIKGMSGKGTPPSSSNSDLLDA